MRKYALNLDKETKRILSVTFEEYASEDMPIVESLPDGNITDYLYKNKKYVYDPLPKDEVEETKTEE